jgi:hypothetical protein
MNIDASEPERGKRFFTAAFVLILGLELVSLPLAIDGFGIGQAQVSAVRAGIFVGFWYFAKSGETLGYWALVLVAFGFSAIIVWSFFTPPAATFSGWTVLQAARLVALVVAGILLLRPDTRHYINRLRNSAE